MEQLKSDFDITRLQQMIDTVGLQVDREPDNTAARLRLAWCFLSRALYRVGQTSVSPSNPHTSSVEGETDANELLQKCLHQVTVVRQISPEPHEQQEAQMLYSLVGMAGQPQLIQQSDEEDSAILHKLMLSIRASGAPARSSLEPRPYPRRHQSRQR